MKIIILIGLPVGPRFGVTPHWRFAIEGDYPAEFVGLLAFQAPDRAEIVGTGEGATLDLGEVQLSADEAAEASLDGLHGLSSIALAQKVERVPGYACPN